MDRNDSVGRDRSSAQFLVFFHCATLSLSRASAVMVPSPGAGLSFFRLLHSFRVFPTDSCQHLSLPGSQPTQANSAFTAPSSQRYESEPQTCGYAFGPALTAERGYIEAVEAMRDLHASGVQYELLAKEFDEQDQSLSSGDLGAPGWHIMKDKTAPNARRSQTQTATGGWRFRLSRLRWRSHRFLARCKMPSTEPVPLFISGQTASNT